MDMREKLLDAAVRVYERTGFRGATTRLIAQEAGVNEVTLFRNFGSKEALIQEALVHCQLSGTARDLPDAPHDAERELFEWATLHFEHFHGNRSLIRRVLGEVDERPEIATLIAERPDCSGRELAAYFERLKAEGLVSPDADSEGATAMLMGALFAESIIRDIIPQIYQDEPDVSLRRYVRLCLDAMQYRPPASGAGAPQRSHTGTN